MNARGLMFGAVLAAAWACSSSDSASPPPSTNPPSADDGGTVEAGDAHVETIEDLLDRPLRDQVDALESGRFTSADLVRAYEARVATRDKIYHAIIVLDPQADANAAALDVLRGQHALLQGSAILVKDNIDTAGIATTAGSLALAANVPAADAFLVKRIKDAHGEMFGKTNLTEWANFRGNKATSGWSAVGGQTFNGANAAYNPCGSSSGSAAAVAAGLASAAIGTETDGSITCPASVNGIVGFKPTVGLVSRAGIIPISHTQDTAGPLARTVGDAARILSAIAGPDPADPATQAIPPGTSLDFEAPLASATLAGKRLGFVDLGFSPEVSDVFTAERQRLVAAGAEVVNVVLDLRKVYPDEFTVMLYEFKADIETYLAAHARAGQAQTLQELIDFNTAHTSTELQYFGQEVFVQAQATTGLATQAYIDAKQRAADGAGQNGITALLASAKLDCLISPTIEPAWMTDYVKGDPPIASASSPAAIAGYPHLSVPMGKVKGLPVGLSFFGAAWDDAKVLALGYAYEHLAR